MKKSSFTLLLLLLFSGFITAQLNVSSDHVSRITQTQRLLIADPADGLVVYQTDGVSGFYKFESEPFPPVGWKHIGKQSGH